MGTPDEPKENHAVGGEKPPCSDDISPWDTHRPGEPFMGGVIVSRWYAFVVVEFPDGSIEKIQIAPLPND